MLEWSRRLVNRGGWARRSVVKAALVAVGALVVCFPDPRVLVRQIARWSDIDRLIEPDAPALDALAARVGAAMAGKARGPEQLRAVQDEVYRSVPYAYDWDTWGALDYVPSVAETMEKGREDCDGRAVVAASLLRRFGYDARIVTNFAHCWVWTPEGETMSPMTVSGSGRAPVRSGEGGTRVDVAALVSAEWLVKDVPRNVAYGVAVFPVWREAALAGWFWIVARGGGARARARREAAGLALVVVAILVCKLSSGDAWRPSVGGAWAAAACAGLGAALVVGVGRKTPPALTHPLPEHPLPERPVDEEPGPGEGEVGGPARPTG